MRWGALRRLFSAVGFGSFFFFFFGRVYDPIGSVLFSCQSRKNGYLSEGISRAERWVQEGTENNLLVACMESPQSKNNAGPDDWAQFAGNFRWPADDLAASEY